VLSHTCHKVGRERVWVDGKLGEDGARCRILGVGLVQQRQRQLPRLTTGAEKGFALLGALRLG